MPTVAEPTSTAPDEGRLACVVIGLGANLGQPEITFRAALEHLRPIGTLVGGSRLYSSKAIGPPQPDYLNAALHISDCPFDARGLVERLLQIEQVFGRVRRQRWGPRSLDLDLLWAGQEVSQHPDAIVPHPRLNERAFALRPLLDLLPFAREPLTDTPYQEVLDALGPPTLHVVGGPEWAQ